jgi:hypothetical protein
MTICLLTGSGFEGKALHFESFIKATKRRDYRRRKFMRRSAAWNIRKKVRTE